MGIKIAIIGLGGIGKKRFEFFKENSEVNEVCFFDRTVEQYNAVRSVGAVKEIFLDSSVDAVAICTPNAQKLDLFSMALESGKHVFCEKPPAISLADTLKIEYLLNQQNGLTIQFGFNHRYLSHYKYLKKIVASKEYGDPLWVRGVYGKGFDESFFSGWRANRDLSGGGILLDQGIHILDLVLDLLGDLTVEHASIDSSRDDQSIDLNSFIQLRSATKVPVSIHSSMYQWRHKFSLEVGTEKAIIGIDGIKSSTKSYGEESIRIDRHWHNNFVESQVNQYANPDYYTFKEECADFVDAIMNNRPPTLGTMRDAVRIMKLIDDIYSFL